MRQARKRSLARRAPYQVGFGITLGVFLCLMGLWVFERIFFLSSVLMFGWNDTMDLPLMLYGPEGHIGPWDVFAYILAGLFALQLFRAGQAKKSGQNSWHGIAFGSCNLLMIGMLAYILATTWAYHYADQPGARLFNRGMKGVPILSKMTSADIWEPDLYNAYDPYPEANGWVQLDDYTYRNERVGIIVRYEIMQEFLPLSVQRANRKARGRPAEPDDLQLYRRIRFTYDLEGHLIWHDGYGLFPRLLEKLETATYSKTSQRDIGDRFSAICHAEKNRLFTYEEILEMVEASWEGIELYPEEDTGEAPNSSPE